MYYCLLIGYLITDMEDVMDNGSHGSLSSDLFDNVGMEQHDFIELDNFTGVFLLILTIFVQSSEVGSKESSGCFKWRALPRWKH